MQRYQGDCPRPSKGQPTSIGSTGLRRISFVARLYERQLLCAQTRTADVGYGSIGAGRALQGGGRVRP